MNGERPAPRGLPTQGGLRTRRLFFALVPGGAARASLQALARQHAPRRARLVGAADLHLTLVFLGAVGEELLPRLRAAAAQLRGAPCTVRLERLERWRGGLLCATGPVPAPLQALHARLVGLARELGLAVDARPLRAHVTLARGLPRTALAAGATTPAGSAGPAGATLPPLRWRSRAFCLMESRRRPDGGRYTIVGRWRLDSAPDAAKQHEEGPIRT
ncbi:MAG: RNA 2',3'-cyclic phosphodiesterase [Steroidobacteraceae bacterium]